MSCRQTGRRQAGNEKPGQTLQATALVHEAYLRLVDVDKAQQWDSRGHFFAAAAEAMRRILVDAARRKTTERHGGKRLRCELLEADLVSHPSDERLLDLDDALNKLADLDKQSAEIVQLRVFAGLCVADTARALGISERTVKRNWAFARAWLRRRMHGGTHGP